MIGGLAAFVGGMIMVRLECTLRLCLTIVDDMFVRFCDFIPMGKSDIIVFRARRCQRAIWVCRCCNPDRDYTGDMWKAVLIYLLGALPQSFAWMTEGRDSLRRLHLFNTFVREA